MFSTKKTLRLNPIGQPCRIEKERNWPRCSLIAVKLLTPYRRQNSCRNYEILDSPNQLCNGAGLIFQVDPNVFSQSSTFAYCETNLGVP